MAKFVEIKGQIGKSGSREVFLGFAPASLLYRISAADVLDEETGQGYQRRFNRQHSLDFRKYMKSPGATTIPLTFNLRPSHRRAWKVSRKDVGSAVLVVDESCGYAMSQVDCQHRLGHLADQDVEFAFMTFIGLDTKEEMEIFGVINGKAKGLSTSLLDYHETQLAGDLRADRPELFIALRLHEDHLSPWHRQLDLGGVSTSGLKRRASLRTMQKATKRFLRQTECLNSIDVESAYKLLRAFWRAVSVILDKEWREPRKHFITKGIGVYALSSIAADLYIDCQKGLVSCDEDHILAYLSDFLNDFDWSTSGPLRGLGGESGVNEAVQMLRYLRTSNSLKVLDGGK